MLLNQVKLKKGAKIIVAVSGGADSVCLLDLLSKQHYKLVVAHLHHGLRGREADRDQNFVKNLAEKYKLPFETEKADVKNFAKKNKLSIEEAARNLRYDFLERVKEKHKARLIATAHTLDDQVETVLLNLLRGSGLKGLAGISSLNNERWRPLLSISKAQILTYLEKNKLKYVEDSSNQELFCTRNKLRHEILPLLKKLNPSLLKTIGRNSLVMREINDYLEDEARNFLKKNFQQNSFKRAAFLKLPLALQKTVLRLLQLEFAGDLLDLGASKIDQALNLILTGKTGKQFRLSERLTFRINYARVECAFAPFKRYFSKQKKPLKVPGQTEFLGQNFKAGKAIKFGSLGQKVAYLDGDKLSKLFLRTVKKGDRFQPSGFRGQKKLQDFFTDQKISLFVRDLVPLVVNAQDEIVWVAGYRVSEKFKATKDSKHILKITL